MVGGFQSIWGQRTGSPSPAFRGRDPRPSGTRSRARARVLAAILLPLALSMDASATGETASTNGAPARQSSVNDVGASDANRARELRVSTSPEDRTARGRSGVRTARKMRTARPELPLTRAAARQQVESISPSAWLEGYGPVTVSQPR